MKLNELAIIGVAATTVVSCTPAKTEYASYELYPVRSGSLTEMEYTPAATQFTLWAPTADEVRLMLFEAGDGGHAYETISMESSEEGTWKTKVEKDLIGKFYTFNVKINDKWLGDTPGINAKAVGVNGKRAAIIDMKSTDPEGWADDKRPALASPADVILYEMHHRDMSIDPSSGIEHKGKFLALTEQGTVSPDKLATGIDHLKELGVTHVHLLPSYDYASVDETRLDENKYNWGYDPQNYNVPDGSYSTDPYKPDVRIREFKQMVQALHKAGIRVVLDVVYNHTFNTSDSNFERTVPGYFYRQRPDGTYADGSACGNETASNRPMMRKYIQGAFLAGLPGGEESIKFGIVGAIRHPQVNNDSVNYSKAPWAEQPTQMISYVSCHDDMCLVDRLKASIPGITPVELAKLDKLAQTAVFTSQGVPFIYAGEEVMRDKKGVHNSFESPDSINAIDWRRKAEHADVFAYYKGLIQLRKKHPAFRMGDADLVRKHLEFLPVDGSNVVVYRLKENANGDAWGDIILVLNARKEPAKLTVPEGKYTVVCKDGFINEQGLGTLYGPEVVVPAQSALIMYK